MFLFSEVKLLWVNTGFKRQIHLMQKIKLLINNIKNTNRISYSVNDPLKPNGVQWCIWNVSPLYH